MDNQPSSTASVHGHEIIHLVNDAATPFTRASLRDEVAARFGPDVRFHTCSTDSMTLDELLHFLISRGKFVERDGQLRAVMANVCDDGQ
jgi:probable metal-binding protein